MQRPPARSPTADPASRRTIVAPGPRMPRSWRPGVELVPIRCHDSRVTPSITLISVPAEDPDTFEAMYIDERRHRSGGWVTFPVRSSRMLDAFFMKATASDLGVLRLADDTDAAGEKLTTCLIDRQSLLQALPDLEALVEAKADDTARALVRYGGGGADVARVTAALGTGEWPTSGDPAEEAAAFAFHLLKSARVAKGDEMGVCWEYRGEIAW